MKQAVPERATYSVKEAAVILGVSERLAYELVRTGEIGSLRLSRRKLVIPRRVIDAMLSGTSA